jgi:hypothetical protein
MFKEGLRMLNVFCNGNHPANYKEYRMQETTKEDVSRT